MHVFHIKYFYCFCCMFLVSYYLMVVYLSLIFNCALSVMTHYYFCVVYCYFEIINHHYYYYY